MPRPVLLIVAVSILLTLPVIMLGFPESYDQMFALGMHRGFSGQVWSGVLYPRWLPGLFNGSGSPVFFYYPPIAYYISAIIAPAVPSAHHALGLAAAMILALSGLTAYLWLKQSFSKSAAAGGALLYIALPYHLYFDLYMNGAYAEFTAYIWLPLVFMGLDQVRQRPCGRSVALAALPYALHIMTHLPTAVVIAPFMVLFAVLTCRSGGGISRREAVRIFSLQMSAALLGAGLAALYLVPALGMLSYVDSGFLWLNMDFRKWFLCIPSCPEVEWAPRLLRQTVYALFQLAFIAFLFALLYRKNKPVFLKDPHLAFWLLTVLAVAILASRFSAPLWDISLILPKIQLPSRFLILLDLAIVWLAACAIDGRIFPRKSILVITYILVVLVFCMPVAQRYIRLYVTEDAVTKLHEQRDEWLSVGFTQFEYLPRAVKTDIGDVFYGDRTPAIRLVDGTGGVVAAEDRARRKLYDVHSESGLSFDVGQFYFPGWRAYGRQNDGPATPLSVSVSGPDGHIRLTVPGGAWRVTLVLEKTAWEKTGLALSAFFLAVFAFLVRRRHS